MRSLSSMIRFVSPVSYVAKSAVAAIATLVIAGCSGGGCASSCAGSGVIPKGFPKEGRVTNAAGVRVTRSGLDFLQDNLGAVLTKVLTGGGGSVTGGIMTFPIPQTDGKVTVLFIPISYTICTDGPKPTEDPPKCIVEINVAGVKNVKITSQTPHDVIVNAVMPVRLKNLPLKVAGISATAGLGDGAADKCSDFGFIDVPITADISLEDIPNDAVHSARAGYTKINIASLTLDDGPIKDNFKFCGSGIGTDILNAIKPLIVGFISSGLTGQLTGPLQNATCMKAQALPDGTLQCPDLTFNRSGTCRYADKDDAECVPMLLGIESRFDLSGLLASLSPGTSGGLDFLLASGGAANPAPGTGPTVNGLTLDMLGGGNPFPISNCVPQAPNLIPTGIEIPDELNANTVTPWAEPTPPHLAIGLAERYLNHAAGAAYNSGLFCIGISSEQIPQLDAGLFKLLLPSLDGLAEGFNAGDSHPSMGLAIRPQSPPTIVVGDNTEDFKSPLLDLNMKDTDLDFYMWSENRFIRLFTGRIDIHVPINLQSEAAGLAIKLPTKEPISFSNPRISNNGILLEDNDKVGKLVQSIGSLIPTSALAAIKPFSLDSALASTGLKLVIPPDGIRKVTKGTDRFMAIFATLEVATSAMPATTTTAAITKYTIDASSYNQLETFGDHPTEVFVHASSDMDDGVRTIEYAYKVDGGLWSTFAPGKDFTVTSPFFLLEGKHTILVSSRISGLVQSQGAPYSLPIIIDVTQPKIRLQNTTPGFIKVQANDLVTRNEDLKVEVRVDGGEWTVVEPTVTSKGAQLDRVVSVLPAAVNIEARATDESGNVASTSAALLRGRADPAVPAASGCGCSMPGNGSESTSTTASLALGALAVVGAVIERRRRRLSRARRVIDGVAASSLMLLSAGAAGCTCGNSNDTSTNPDTDTGDDRPNLVTYVIGSYTSAVQATDGKIWIAGYNEGDPSTGSSDDFKGDLAVGTWNTTTSVVDWVVVDGVPQVEPTANHNGFRGGISDPGDDVGLYTSIVLDSKQNPIVTYYDKTNGALRGASYDGTKWTSFLIASATNGWAGRWTSMVSASGKAAVAFQSYEAGAGGFGNVRVRVARATTDTPTQQSDWTLEDVVVDSKAACIQDICSSGQKCLLGDATAAIDPVCSATTTGCDASCTDVCIKGKDGKPACAKAKPVLAGYVNAIGSYISLAATTAGDLGVVFYDRSKGNLRGAVSKGGKWVTTPATAPIDGWVGDVVKDKGNGDRGIGATLAIDATGNWHIAYVDGIKETLLYKFIAGGDFTKATPAVVVDDGTSADGGTTKFTDGIHLIGEDSHLVLTGTSVQLAYQDSTSGTLRWAKGTGGATSKFTRGVITQDGFGGFYPTIVGDQVANFYRMKGLTQTDVTSGTPGDPVILGNVRVLTLP